MKIGKTISEEKASRQAYAKAPRVTVLMPVYNGSRFLKAAVDSILGQSFVDFELLVVDDGSTDGTPRILAKYDDQRLQVIRQENAGVSAALNAGLQAAKGKYIARMDADDIARSDRLKQQVDFLDGRPDVDLVSSSYTAIDEEGNCLHVARVMCHPLTINRFLLEANCIVHPSVMVRASVYQEHGVYDVDALHVEDYDLWVRASNRIRIACLPEPLLSYRFHPQKIGEKHKTIANENMEKVKTLAWEQVSSQRLQLWTGMLAGYACAMDLRRQFAGKSDRQAWLNYHFLAFVLVTARAASRRKVKLFFQLLAETKGFALACPRCVVSTGFSFLQNLWREKTLNGAMETMTAQLNGTADGLLL